MNYAAHYERLVSRARTRILGGYFERHHIIPRCMGGGNEATNIVRLTAEEHYVAHQLLAKIYPSNGGLIWAAIRLSRNSNTSRAYGWLRRRHSIARSLAQRGRKRPPEVMRKLSDSRLGKPLSEEHRRKISEKLLGNSCRSGKPASAETCARISAGGMGNKNSKGRKLSLETRAKMSASAKVRHQVANDLTACRGFVAGVAKVTAP